MSISRVGRRLLYKLTVKSDSFQQYQPTGYCHLGSIWSQVHITIDMKRASEISVMIGPSEYVPAEDHPFLAHNSTTKHAKKSYSRHSLNKFFTHIKLIGGNLTPIHDQALIDREGLQSISNVTSLWGEVGGESNSGGR